MPPGDPLYVQLNDEYLHKVSLLNIVYIYIYIYIYI